MDFLDKISRKLYDDLLKHQKKVDFFKSINKYAWFTLGFTALVIYLAIFLSKNAMIVFDNPILVIFIYLGLLSIIATAACNIYSKDPKEKAEFLRKKLIEKIEKDEFCTVCSDKCIHRDELVDKAEKQHKINLYY